MINIISFILGIFIGMFSFSVILLPIFYSIPQSILFYSCDLISKRTFYRHFISPIFWILLYIVIFSIFFYLLPSFFDMIIFNAYFFFGLIGCLIFSSLRAHSMEGRRDIQEDYKSFISEEDKYIFGKEESIVDWFLKNDEKTSGLRNLFPDKVEETKEIILDILKNNSTGEQLKNYFVRLTKIYRDEIFPKFMKMEISYVNLPPRNSESYEILFVETELSVLRRILGYFLKYKYSIDPLTISFEKPSISAYNILIGESDPGLLEYIKDVFDMTLGKDNNIKYYDSYYVPDLIEIAKNNKIDFVVLTLNNIRFESNYTSWENEISKVSEFISYLKENYNIPIIALSSITDRVDNTGADKVIIIPCTIKEFESSIKDLTKLE